MDARDQQMMELQKRIAELEEKSAKQEEKFQQYEEKLSSVFTHINELYKAQNIESTVEILSDLGKNTLQAEKSAFWCVDLSESKVFTVDENKNRIYADISQDEMLSIALSNAQPTLSDSKAAIPIKADSGEVMGVVVAEKGNFDLSNLKKFYSDGEIGSVFKLGLEKERQHQISITDKLTHLKNRVGLTEYAQNSILSSISQEKPVTLIMCDIDHFKNVNDTYGHDAGDKVLQHIAQILKDNIRDNDSVFRQGGEEFVIAFDDTEKSEAFAVSDRIRQIIEQTPCVIDANGKSINVTISMGVEQISTERAANRDNVMQIIDNSLKNADTRLYTAKETGRNKVVVDLTETEKEQALSRRKNDVQEVHHKKIIGNTAYNALGIKSELQFFNDLNNRHAENIARELDKAGIKYSGVVINDKTTITVNKADASAFYKAESDVKMMYSNKSTRSDLNKWQEKAQIAVDKHIEPNFKEH